MDLEEQAQWIRDNVADAEDYIKLLTSKETIEVGELVQRFTDIDKHYEGEPWNLQQILANIMILT